ncbi:Diacylglycerol O-acyltransferase [Frankia canadensis]|uniref:diacylglycerol O-acyltransferase n=1 Tax=Frankia canadensis TaxID=1836972 RepID=A0A2I2KNZ0_9ACTN|nr:wax ester/triacylglycerol synthase domain-containing protein [Frankia canadensis]SNQ47393.1 Diacylglycerol O-acyltransferase [Frankia canadensis]SOU54683.1 Diacylglycerol O-acyltransferase [Frankia canadensis]
MHQPSTAATGTPPATGGARRALTTGDRAFLHYSRLHPGEYLEAGVVLVLDGPALGVEELRAHVARRLRAAPALTERLAPPGAPVADLGWETDPTLDLDHHVTVEDLPPGGGTPALRAAMDLLAAQPLAAQPLAAAPLAAQRPLWRLTLLRGHSPATSAVAYRFSHIHQDGAALHQALHLLFGADRDPALRSLPAAFPSPRARDHARMAAALLRSSTRSRGLAAWGGPPRGEARHSFALADLDLLRGLGRRHGATVNDVYLAALAGALRAWSRPEWDRGRRPLHAAMPINLRTRGESEMLSNITFGTRIRLPCDEDDPRRRLARVAGQTRRVRAAGGLRAVQRRILEAVPPDAPAAMLAHIASAGARPTRAALVASNVGTMRGPYTVAGRPVRTLLGMPPLFVGRQYLSAALFGLDTQVCAAFAASASVPGHDALPDLWLADLAALENAGTPGRRRRIRRTRG